MSNMDEIARVLTDLSHYPDITVYEANVLRIAVGMLRRLHDLCIDVSIFQQEVDNEDKDTK